MKNTITCDACGKDFDADSAEVSKRDLVVCPKCKELESGGVELTTSPMIRDVMGELGVEPLPPTKKSN